MDSEIVMESPQQYLIDPIFWRVIQQKMEERYTNGCSIISPERLLQHAQATMDTLHKHFADVLSLGLCATELPTDELVHLSGVIGCCVKIRDMHRSREEFGPADSNLLLSREDAASLVTNRMTAASAENIILTFFRDELRSRRNFIEWYASGVGWYPALTICSMLLNRYCTPETLETAMARAFPTLVF